MIIDIHTHRPYPQPEGIISKALRPDSAETSEMKTFQLYSVGMHPWDTQDTEDAGLFARLEEIAAQPNVAAIGECGIDLLRGAPMFRQLLVFRRHVEISEKLRKPLIIHDVKADDIICGLRRDMKPTQPLVHTRIQRETCRRHGSDTLRLPHLLRREIQPRHTFRDAH